MRSGNIICILDKTEFLIPRIIAQLRIKLKAGFILNSSRIGFTHFIDFITLQTVKYLTGADEKQLIENND